MRCNAKRWSRLIFEDGPQAVGFSCWYAHGRITRGDFRFDGCAAFYAGKTLVHTLRLDAKIKLDIYTEMCGVTLSPDEQYLFIPSWEKGITCLSMTDGRILWQFKGRYARSVYSYEDFIVCCFEGQRLCRISFDGQELQRLPFSTSAHDDMLEDGTIFIGPKRGRYFLLRPEDFAVLHTIPENRIACSEDDHIVYQVTGTQDCITCHGWYHNTHARWEIPLPEHSGIS